MVEGGKTGGCRSSIMDIAAGKDQQQKAPSIIEALENCDPTIQSTLAKEKK